MNRIGLRLIAPLLALLWMGQILAATKGSLDKNIATNTSANASNPAGGGDRVFPGDKVAFSVAEDPTGGVSSEFLVDPKNNLHLPVSAGFKEEIVINVENKTIPEIQKELKQKLDATYYKNATVALSIGAQAVQPGKITITGPVRNNFVLLLPGERKKILETVLRAGPSEFANLKKVKLMRISPETGKTEEKIINVEDIKRDPTKDVPMRDGDRLNIPEKSIIFQ